MRNEKEIGDAIRQLRGTESLRSFAQKCDVSHTTIDNLEKGVDFRTGKPTQAKMATLQKIARACNVPISRIVGEETRNRPNRSKNYSVNMPLRIKSMRLAHGYTQKMLADKLHKSESAVRMWELGKSEPDSETINAMSELFGISTDYLLGKPFDLAVPIEQWHRSLREDYECEEPALQEYLMFKYGKGYFPKTEKMPSAPEGTEGMGENDRRLFTLWNQVPEVNKPEILNLIEVALRMQRGNSNE